MAAHFDENYFHSLDDRTRDRLLRIIVSGLMYPDSRMGAYVLDGMDYETFAQVLDPMIRDYHHDRAVREPASPPRHDLRAPRFKQPQVNAVLPPASFRVRVARNIAAFPFAASMTKTQRLELEEMMIDAFRHLQEDPAFCGRYFSLSPGSPRAIDPALYDRLVKAHHIFRDMRQDQYLRATTIADDWPFGRGAYISSSEDFMIWVGEEDHLRIMVLGQASETARLLAKLQDGIERLSNLLPAFDRSPHYGYLTSCPTNIGTGMRASLHLTLPHLTAGGGELRRVKKVASQAGLSVRGSDGEGTGPGSNGLVDLSPRARFGVSEDQILQKLFDGAAALWSLEIGGPAAPDYGRLTF